MTTFTWLTHGIENGLPEHMPIPVDIDGQGPVLEGEAHAWMCWCGDDQCLLTKALAAAWVAGYRHGYDVGRSVARS